MKRLLTLALTGACLLALWGCGKREEEKEGSYRVYFSALEDPRAVSAVDYELWELPQDTGTVDGLLRLLLRGPVSEGLTSPFPEGTALLDWSLEEGCLTLDLSEQYGSLTGVDLSVADACLALTLCQAEGVESVYVTVEGGEIPYRPIQQLSPDALLLTDETRVSGLSP